MELNIETESTVYIAGHSLGGGLSALVAGRLASGPWKTYEGMGKAIYGAVVPRVEAINISPPGVFWSSKKFGFDPNYMYQLSTDLYARRDIVPLADKHVGARQIEYCNQESFIDCHSSILTFCRMFRACGLAPTRNRELAACFCCVNGNVAADGNRDITMFCTDTGLSKLESSNLFSDSEIDTIRQCLDTKIRYRGKY